MQSQEAIAAHVNRRRGRASGQTSTKKNHNKKHAERFTFNAVNRDGESHWRGFHLLPASGVTPCQSSRLACERRRSTAHTMVFFPGCETASAQLHASEPQAGSATTFLQLFRPRSAKGQRPLEAGRCEVFRGGSASGVKVRLLQ